MVTTTKNRKLSDVNLICSIYGSLTHSQPGPGPRKSVERVREP